MSDDGWVSSAFAHLAGGEGADDPGADLAETDPAENRGSMRAGVDAERRGSGPSRDELVTRVLQTVLDIPPAHAMTYGDIAAVVGCGPRQVGRILSTTQETVPWWRVTNASGLLPETLRERAHARYDDEGTPVRGHWVDLARARWRPM